MELAVAELAADLGLVIPARFAAGIRSNIRGAGQPELPRDPSNDGFAHRGGVLKEAAQVAHGPQLHGEPEPVLLAAAAPHHLLVALVEQEELGQLVRRQPLREPPVVRRWPAPALAGGLERDHLGWRHCSSASSSTAR